MLKPILQSFALLALLTACKADVTLLEKILNDLNYVRLKPASNLYAPGNLVYRDTYDPRDSDPSSTFLGKLCNDKYSTDLYDTPPQTSPSDSTELSSKLAGSFSIEPETLLKLFGLNATAEASRTINVTLSDVSVKAYALDDLQIIRSNLGPVCRGILNKNIHVKKNAYQIEKTLTATVRFVLEFETEASASAKAKAIAELGKIGVVIESANKTEVNGTALVYGVKWLDLVGEV